MVTRKSAKKTRSGTSRERQVALEGVFIFFYKNVDTQVIDNLSECQYNIIAGKRSPSNGYPSKEMSVPPRAMGMVDNVGNVTHKAFSWIAENLEAFRINMLFESCLLFIRDKTPEENIQRL